jgi:hypothetical protein
VHLPVTIPLHHRFSAPWQTSAVRVVTLGLRSDGLLELARGDGTCLTCQVHPHTAVFPWLIVLLYRTSRGLESLVLSRFSMTAEAHRQLRLWLRWKAQST